LKKENQTKTKAIGFVVIVKADLQVK